MSRFELTRERILEVIRSLIADELQALRPQASEALIPEDWNTDTWVSKTPPDPQTHSLEVDSLERMALATRLADFFQVRESGLEDYLLRFNTLGQWADLMLEARQRGTQNLTFLTSGSSGTAKPCKQNWDNLVAEVIFFRDYFVSLQQQPIKRILALSPSHHIYGFLFSAILPDLLQVPVIRGHQAFFQVQGRKLLSGDLVIGFPYIWKQLARSQQPFPEGVLGLTSTGPCDPQVITTLQQQGLLTLVEIYGASETAGIGYRTNPNLPFQLLPRWQACPEDSQALVDKTSQNLVTLNDRLTWQSPELFYPQGRIDEAVQVGGINVFPQSLAKRLAALPGVQAAQVRLMSPHEGERLKAFIVPDTQAAKHPDALLEEIRTWCQQHLTAAEQPKAFTLGEQLPINEQGKACDWSINPTLSQPKSNL